MTIADGQMTTEERTVSQRWSGSWKRVQMAHRLIQDLDSVGLLALNALFILFLPLRLNRSHVQLARRNLHVP